MNRGGDHSSEASAGKVARFGPIDMRAQAEVPSALRTDTPKSIKEVSLALCGGRSALADGPCLHLNGCHPQPVSAYIAAMMTSSPTLT